MRRPWVVLTKDAALTHDMIVNLIGIHQLVFMFELQTGNVHEVYNINGIRIDRIIVANGTLTENGRNLQRNRASNFHGLNLRVLTAYQAPFVYRTKKLIERQTELLQSKDPPMHFNIDLNDVTGVFISALKTLADEMNFTMSLMLRTDNHYGTVAPNGSWIGIAGDLNNRLFDFAATSISVTLARFPILGYAPPMAKETAGIFIQKRNLEERAWLSFFFPFTNQLWLGLGINFLALLMIIKGLQLLYNRTLFTDQPLTISIRFQVMELMLGSSCHLISAA